MAKTRSGRYTSSGSLAERFRQSRKDKELKEKNPKKYKRQKAIAKASSDGKITKKEAQKLAKKGISLAAIRNRNISEFRSAQRSVSEANRNRNSDRRTYDYAKPSFQPLKITGGAERVFGQKQQGKMQPPPPTMPVVPPAPPMPPKPKPVGWREDKVVDTAPKSDPVADALAALQQTIASYQPPDYGAELDAMRAEQENYMQRLAAQQAEAERQRELTFRISQENIARSGLMPDFRIGARSPRDSFGTSAFRRRPRYTSTIAQGISPNTAAQTLNI